MRNMVIGIAIATLLGFLALVVLQVMRTNPRPSTTTPILEMREFRTLKGHTGFVNAVAFSPNGRTIASGSADRTTRICEAASGRELRTLQGNTDAVFSVAFSPDGRMIASGGDDDIVKLWDNAIGRQVRALHGHSGRVKWVVFSPDGREIASASADKTIKLWDVATGEELRTLQGHSDFVGSVVFSPDGRTIASGSDDGTVKLWDAASGQELRTLRGHNGWVHSVAFSPDGRTLVSGDEYNTINLWNAASGEELRTLLGHTGYVYTVAFSPDGWTVASGSADNTIRLWDAASGRQLLTLQGHTGYVYSVAFSPDGRTLASASADDTIKLWDLSALVTNSMPNPGQTPTPPVVVPPPVTPQADLTPPSLDRRFALVIGNSAYPNAALANPALDADLVSASLRKSGFDVTEVKNADFVAFDDALTRFVGREEGADIALFYFAGHGFAIPGDDLRPRNYLMATSANLRATSDAVLRRDGVTIDEVIRRISASAKVTLAFVDACRNDPFHRGAGDRGFQPIEVASTRQVFIGMSTQLGKTALDGDDGRGSPFAQAFAVQMTTPGLRIDDAFRALREEVSRKTDGVQKPEILQDDLQQGALVLVKGP